MPGVFFAYGVDPDRERDYIRLANPRSVYQMLFEIRNAAGQFLGTFYAKSAKHAIQRFIDSQAVQAATFRRSVPMLKFENLTAIVVQPKESSR